MRSATRRIQAAICAALTLAAVILFSFPIFWTAFTGLKQETDALSFPPSVFVPLSLNNYASVFVEGDYGSFVLNSVIAVGVSLALALVLAIPAAYRLAFFPGRKANDLLFFALSTRFMPGVATIVPIILIFARIGLLDSYVGLIVLYTALDIPLALWLMRTFFRDIPFEIIEASLMDGASHARVLLRIVLPLARGGLVTTGVLLTVLSWNEFFFAVNVTGRDTATLPVYMASFLTTEGMGWARMAAALTLAILPVMALGLSTSRSLVRGLVAGAVK
jgi:sorbitol/mannitol transport system permease protein